MRATEILKKIVHVGSQVEVGTRATAILGLGAILVGGYSHGAGFTGKHSQKSSFVPPTFGIVAQIEGLVYVGKERFEFKTPGGSVRRMQIGDSVLIGNRIWVDTKAKLGVIDGNGSAVLVQGPAIVEIASERKIATLQGTFRVIGKIEIHTPFSAAKSDGEFAAWISKKQAQFVAVRKKTFVWNPHLENEKDAVVDLLPGWYTEAFVADRQLQPRRPRLVDGNAGSELLANLDAMWLPTVAQETAEILFKRPVEDSKGVRGSRVLADVREEANPEAVEAMKERLFKGVDEVYTSLEVAGRKQNAQLAGSRSFASVPLSEEVASKTAFPPGMEIRVERKKLNEEQRTLLESLKTEIPRY